MKIFTKYSNVAKVCLSASKFSSASDTFFINLHGIVRTCGKINLKMSPAFETYFLVVHPPQPCTVNLLPLYAEQNLEVQTSNLCTRLMFSQTWTALVQITSPLLKA